jgi:hypothetical protein
MQEMNSSPVVPTIRLPAVVCASARVGREGSASLTFQFKREDAGRDSRFFDREEFASGSPGREDKARSTTVFAKKRKGII